MKTVLAGYLSRNIDGVRSIMSKVNQAHSRAAIRFFSDQHGGVSIKDILWVSLFVGFSGLAFSMLGEFRIQTALQTIETVPASASSADEPIVTAGKGDTAAPIAVNYFRTQKPNFRYGDSTARDGSVIGDWENPRRDLRLPVSVK
jgi:hypothetical protein